MFLSKNLIIISALIACFVAGGMLGFYLGSKKSNISEVFSESKNNLPGKSFSSPNAEPSKTDLTAKEALVIAEPEAFLWSKDAYLAEISLFSEKFNPSGTSNGWKFIFYSAAKKMAYEIAIKDGESRGGKERISDKSMQTLKGNIIDSAILAKSFFALYSENTETISLKMYFDQGSKKFLWTIFFPKGSHTINAEI